MADVGCMELRQDGGVALASMQGPRTRSPRYLTLTTQCMTVTFDSESQYQTYVEERNGMFPSFRFSRVSRDLKWPHPAITSTTNHAVPR